MNIVKNIIRKIFKIKNKQNEEMVAGEDEIIITVDDLRRCSNMHNITSLDEFLEAIENKKE